MRSILLLLPALSVVAGYNILCVFPVPSRSHNTLGKGVVNALLKAGHQVTWITPYTIKNEDKNLTVIISGTETIGKDVNMMDPKNAKGGLSVVKEFTKKINAATLSNELLRKVVTNTQFDAVVTEWFFSNLFSGFAAVQKAPWILLNSVTYNPIMESMVDEVRSVPTVPLFMNDAHAPMDLRQRLFNTVMFAAISFGELMSYNSVAADYERYFGPLAAARGLPLPPFSEVEKNVSILFVNSHPSYSLSYAMPANVIPIAGYHIPEEVAALPKDLKTIIESAPNGVVYFSMGSVLKSSAIPAETQRALVKMLGDLPHTVLWKFEEDLEGLPRNVHIRPWFPQPSVLAHPNIKLFITHGGMLSSLEAINAGVPLLTIPVFGDQPSNAARATNAGYARTVAFDPEMVPELTVVLNDMLTDDKYYKRAKYLSKLFRNREVAPSKLVSHYVEVAIESKGAYHLRSPSLLYPWYQRWMLDQLAILLAALYLIKIAVKKLFSLIFSSKKDKKVKRK